MSELFSKFEIPTSNTLGGVAETQTVLQCVMVKNMLFRHEYESKLYFPCAQVQCMSELCIKFQIPATNTVGADVETRTVLQCNMVQNMYVIQGDIILK